MKKQDIILLGFCFSVILFAGIALTLREIYPADVDDLTPIMRTSSLVLGSIAIIT